MEDHKADVKAFAEEALAGWIPFFIDVLKQPLPSTPSDQDDHAEKDAESSSQIHEPVFVGNLGKITEPTVLEK